MGETGTYKRVTKGFAYRPEIDGLRAIAILGVLIYHLDHAWLPGGFVGVDVFFVISGFLITSIILHEIDTGEFSFRNFYLRRVKRLFPAMAVVLVSVLIYQGVVSPFGYDLTRRTGIWVLGLAGNVYVQMVAGDYFAPNDENPLLHTWSLGVEEQFYLSFPILLFAVAKFRRRFALPFMGFVAILSFVWCVVTTTQKPSDSFYLLPSRAWELLVGCLLAIGVTDYKKAFERMAGASCWSAVGVGMVLASYGGIFSEFSFPGWCAAVPAIGGGLLLATTNPSPSAVGKLLRSRFLVSIGKMSYSLYLWHWPVFLGVERWMKGPIHPTLAPDWATPVVSLALSFALAGVCYKWVESPLRGWRWTPVLSGFVALALIIGMGSVKEARLTAKYVAKRDQTFVTERSNEWVGNHRGNKATDLPAGTEIKVTAGLGRLNQGVVRKYGSDRIDVMVVGDSHGEALESMFDHLLQSQKLTGVFFCYPGQPPDSIITGERNRSRFVPEAIRSFRAEQKMVLDSDFPRVVVYVTRYEARKYGDYPLSLRYVLDRAPCIFLQQPPVLNVENISLADQLSVYLSRGRSLDKLDIREKPESTLKRRRFEKSLFSEFGGSPGFIFLKTDDVFCQPSGQARWWDGTSRLYYRDDDHLSESGASLLEGRMLAAINAALKKTL